MKIARKNSCGNLGRLLIIRLGRRLFMYGHYDAQDSLVYLAGNGEEVPAQESVSA